MRVILINAKERAITERQINASDKLTELQGLVGGNVECATVLPNGEEVYVNEEGLLNNPDDFFTIEGAHQPFAGNGFIVAIDEEGDWVESKTLIEDLENHVGWQKAADVIATQK